MHRPHTAGEDPRLELTLGGGHGAAGSVNDALAALAPELEPLIIEHLAAVSAGLLAETGEAPKLPPEDRQLIYKLWISPGRVRVELADLGFGFGVRAAGEGRMLTGWRLGLVERLANRWGVVKNERLTIWFEIDRRSTETPMADRRIA